MRSNKRKEELNTATPDYEYMYHMLFNAMNDAAELLIKAMRECEEQYIGSTLPPVEEEKKHA